MGEYSTSKQEGYSLLRRQDYLWKDLSLHRKMINVLGGRIDSLYSYLDLLLDEGPPAPNCSSVLSAEVLEAYRNLSQAHTMYMMCNKQIREVSDNLLVNDNRLRKKALNKPAANKKVTTPKAKVNKTRTKARKKPVQEDLPKVPVEEADRLREELEDMLEDLYNDND